MIRDYHLLVKVNERMAISTAVIGQQLVDRQFR